MGIKKQLLLVTALCLSYPGFGQSGKILENKVTLFSLPMNGDIVDFIVVDTLLQEKKPVFLWCQGSLPVPLFGEIDNYGTYFFGGGIQNFDYQKITAQYHLVIISMPNTPVVVPKNHLNQSYHYIPDPNQSNQYCMNYLRADHLTNYLERALSVLTFLRQQEWVLKDRLVVAGHSQGAKVAVKIAAKDANVTHLGLFSANLFGRIDQFIREARIDAQQGKITWEQADARMNEQYAFYRMAQHPDSLANKPGLLAWHSFSKPLLEDLLSLNVPVHLAYGTEDRVADLCDIIPLYFIGAGKDNLKLKRYIGLEHNFFELNEVGKMDHSKAHWPEVMQHFIERIE